MRHVRFFHRHPITTLAAAALTVLASPAGADERHWAYASGCASQDFTSTNCWRLGAFGQPGGGTVGSAPAAHDAIYLQHSASSNLIVNFANLASPLQPTYGSVNLAGSGSGFAGLLVERNKLEAGRVVLQQRGRIIQTGGEVRLGTANLLSDSAYQVSGGFMTAAISELQFGSQFNQSGGTVAPGLLRLGGRYFLDGGTLDMRSGSFQTTGNGQGLLELGGGALQINPGQLVKADTINFIGGDVNNLRNAVVEAGTLKVRNDYSTERRTVEFRSNTNIGRLEVGGAATQLGALFSGGTHATGTVTVDAAPDQLAFVTLGTGNAGTARFTTGSLQLDRSNATSRGTADFQIASGSGLTVSGNAEIGQTSESGFARLLIDGSATVNGNMAVEHGRLYVGSTAPGQLTVAGTTSLAAAAGRRSDMWIASGGAFTGGNVSLNRRATVSFHSGGGSMAAVDNNRTFTNEGWVFFADGSTGRIGHNFHNQPGGRVVVGSGSAAIFQGHYAGEGSVDIAAGGVVRFEGDVTLEGSHTGAGRSDFLGAAYLSDREVGFAGDVTFHGSSRVFAAAWPWVPTSGRLSVGGTLEFGGTLVLARSYGEPFLLGDRYDLFDWGTATGSFSGFDFTDAPLDAGLFWDTAELYTQGVMKVSAVPEPGAWALWLAGISCMGALYRRRRT